MIFVLHMLSIWDINLYMENVRVFKCDFLLLVLFGLWMKTHFSRYMMENNIDRIESNDFIYGFE